MLSGLLILDISFQNKFCQHFRYFWKEYWSQSISCVIKWYPLVSNGHTLEYGVPLVASLYVHSGILGVQSGISAHSLWQRPMEIQDGFFLSCQAKLDLGMYLMQCSSFFLNYSNHLNRLELATVSLRSHKMMLNTVGSYI